MMMEGGCSGKKRAWPKDDFTDVVLKWSLHDIFNENRYKDQVEWIPELFESVGNYLGSYIYPLLEETRAQLASAMEFIHQAPFAEVQILEEAKSCGKFLYDVKVDQWKNKFVDHGKELYKVLPGDILVISDSKPETSSDLQRLHWSWTLASVTDIKGEGIDESTSSTKFKVKTPEDMPFKGGKQDWLYVVYLTNTMTNKRIWKALHWFKNLTLIEKVLCSNAMVEEQCDSCSVNHTGQLSESFGSDLYSQMNESQTEAIRASLHKMTCDQNSHIELIWGPPGTGKTKTVSQMLFILLRMNYRTLCCAPTNVAVKEVASRVVKLVKEAYAADSEKCDPFTPLGDIILFGNKDRLKVAPDIEDIYLDYRVKRLVECFAPSNGLKHCVRSMIDLLEHGASHYHIFLENELIKTKENKDEAPKDKPQSFLEFIRARVKAILPSLRRCLITFCTHVPKSFVAKQNFENMVHLIYLLESLEKELSEKVLTSDILEKLYSSSIMVEDFSKAVTCTLFLPDIRSKCLFVLKTVHSTLENLGIPAAVNEESIRELCFQMATLVFCTASTSYKLHRTNVEPLKVLVIDEAAQLKECESLIPLQLPGLKHAILVGDECQLPASVNSKISANAAFGRSLFERLSSLGQPKHLLNIQYRMHPSISCFPNSIFYSGKIMDAPEVRSKMHERYFLREKMFGPYSFINVPGGKEDSDGDDYSLRNIVEAAVVVKIVQKLYKAWNGSDTSLSVGVISPYAAQVALVQEKLRHKFENLDNFVVTVKSIDGYQGGEQDIVLLSTVRANNKGSIGFLSSPQRTNVALTRARADEDADVSNTILDVKKELDQMEDLLNGDSTLFKQQRWKVLFSDDFQKSFRKMTSTRMKKLVLNLLLSLASGWRPKKINVDLVCERSSQIVKHFKVEGLYVVCSIDIVKKSNYMQVLKVWDILPLEEIPKLLKRLDNIFNMYTDDFINQCEQKCLKGRAELPKCWPNSSKIIRHKNMNNGKSVADSTDSTLDGGCYAENSRVSESLQLMKFYSLSPGAASHLLFSRDGQELDLPFEVTDEEWEIIQFCKSSFILGRSGTGKTTVLSMKLFEKEQIYHIASEGFTTAENSMSTSVLKRTEFDHSTGVTRETFLRQLFVTVSPRLCSAVKHHVSRLISVACSGNFPSETSLNDAEDVEDIEQFKDIPDSFVGIPSEKYPLVITFHKFLMMLDGTIGDSYFRRFPEMMKIMDYSVGISGNFRSAVLQSLLRMKEVNYERFCFHYWPHFNSQLTKNLDSSRTFTEIISHIKGGLLAGEAPDGKLSRQEYVSMSNSRASTLSSDERELIYTVFQAYEKKKLLRGEFDLSDFVIDLHLRLKCKSLDGDKMDFVYIDEVQDLAMSQIALFKYICKNVDEGFVFSGDTAQTIARGTDFRFEDIRSLFYNEFIMKSKSDKYVERKEKGRISEVFNLHQNFRTHAGVLKLAQSVTDLLYQFFPQSVDILRPEISFIYGEAPVLLKPNESAIEIIFGKTAKTGRKVVGFGAEQVILVRDDSAREGISRHAGNHALVLTILECKGLEFQDVLLYNFFSSSPLKNQWRVVYDFMEKKDLRDSCFPRCFPSFSHARHSILCSELKQLYVAITRTRQRLWICEDSEEFAAPMFDFWKKLGLVQVKEVDESFSQTMLMASSPAEWKSRGIKLYQENKYHMATMCFERAGDTNWEKRAKAASLRATADQLRESNPQEACTILRQAAELFDSIGRAESAAECFCDLGDYERAGRIYFDKCRDPKKAGDCFTSAKSYKLAAKAYADGNYLLECLSACTQGNLFELGRQYIKKWKQAAPGDDGAAKQSKEIEKVGQEFLESCALSYYKLKDHKSMIKYVRAFLTMDSRRKFLKSIGCLDELLLLEEELGNFKEAVEIAKLRGDYERAGRIYFDKCGDPKNAGDCFTSARSYELAAKAYADGNYLLECLSVCTQGNLFELGRQYITKWKQNAPGEKEIEKIEQEFLESCGLSYYKLKDFKSMIEYVRAFLSMDSRRNFLKSIGCIDELLLLEEELGNFEEAIEIAKLRGDLPREADLLGKAGHLKEASLLIISFVLHRSLWVTGNRGWPLRPFRQKQMLLKKAMSFAQEESNEFCESNEFYERIRREVEVLSHEHISLHELLQSLTYSELCKNLTVELISIRRILDAHLDCTARKFEWEDELQVDMKKHSEDKISLNHISVGSLMYFWDMWRRNMLNIMQYLKTVEKPDDNEWLEYGEFCLNYFGVRRQVINSNVAYILLNSDAEWVKTTGSVFKQKHQRENQVSIDGRKFASAALSHCQAEVVSVSLKVLDTVEALYKLSIRESFSLFCQSICLIDIYQLMKFLTESFKFNDSVKKRLENFLWTPITYFKYVFPLDCCKSMVENMISLRKTELSRSLLEEVIVDNISNKGDLTYGQIGRVVMIWLGSGKPTDDLYMKIAKRFEKNFSWRAFIDSLQVSSLRHSGITESRSSGDPSSNTSGEDWKKFSLIDSFHEALRDTYLANWRSYDYISPDCLIYLVERLLLLVFHSKDYFFTTKYSFVEWLIYLKADMYPDAGSVADTLLSPEIIFDSVVMMVEQFLFKKQETASWIAKSKFGVNQYHPLLALRLVVILCLLHLNSGKYSNVLSHLLDQSHISSQLPMPFIQALRPRRMPHLTQDWFSLNATVEAFRRIGNPLVIVHLRENSPKFACPAIIIDTALTPRIDDIMRNLFPKQGSYHQQRPMVEANVPNLCEEPVHNAESLMSIDISAAPDQKMSSDSGTESNPQMYSCLSEKISDV
nr:uncharacterized protein LOC113736561 isoform X2 [Coffea arabica]